MAERDSQIVIRLTQLSVNSRVRTCGVNHCKAGSLHVTDFGKKLGIALICGSLMASSSAASAASTTATVQDSKQWMALSALGTTSSAAAVSAAQENPNWADPYADHSGHGLGASVVLLGLGLLLVIAVIALSHDSDDDVDTPISPF